ncbi:MAG: hypothetical protein RH942_03425 [Kiloniellaceae bacterium]
MLKNTALAAVMLAFMATPALAARCPADAKAIEADLAASTLSDAEKAEITALKDEGMAQHAAGDHGAAVATLAKAMSQLQMAK